jgi:dGTPase
MSSSIDKLKTVKYSLKAPESLAKRASGKNEGQAIRTRFMRDRDRILYSKSFRRLSGKTQVFLSGIDDHKRTRLTHTLEVSQIARTISFNLRLDLDLTEAIALGHDIGHTPYGHAGERVLHEIMTPHDNHIISNCPLNSKIIDYDLSQLGFKHNLQSLKNAIQSEKNYGDFGLDLTNFTLFGLKFHSGNEYKEDKIGCHNMLGFYNQFDKFLKIDKQDAWSFEAFVVREADEIAQRHHDLEDAIRGNLISKNEVCLLIKQHFGDWLSSNDHLDVESGDEKFIADLSRLVVNLLVKQLVSSSIYNINLLILTEELCQKKYKRFVLEHSPCDHIISNIISYTKQSNKQVFLDNLRNFEKAVSERVLASYDIQRADSKGRYIIIKLFQAFYTTPQQLPNHSIIEFMVETGNFVSYDTVMDDIRVNGMGHIRNEFVKYYRSNVVKDAKLQIQLMRVICDYIAGMTDNYALATYQQLYS